MVRHDISCSFLSSSSTQRRRCVMFYTRTRGFFPLMRHNQDLQQDDNFSGFTVPHCENFTIWPGRYIRYINLHRFGFSGKKYETGGIADTSLEQFSVSLNHNNAQYTQPWELSNPSFIIWMQQVCQGRASHMMAQTSILYTSCTVNINTA